MVEIGKYNVLNVVKKTDAGIHLDAEDFGELLLPKEELVHESESKAICEVFLYCDSKENVVATTRKPYGCVGEFAYLKAVTVTEMGAFLDWGLPKDLFVPNRDQQKEMEEGESYIVYIYQEPIRNRLAASSKLENYLSKDPADFAENEKVNLLIAHETGLGINAIINHSYWGLLYHDEVFQDLKYGQKAEGYIKKLRPDNKIDLSLEFLGYTKKDDLEEKILFYLKKNDGKIKITDKSSPEKIYELFGVSKKKYKVALGSLYKNKRIILEEDAVRLI